MRGMLKTQRRLASRLLGVGEAKVWLDPAKFKEIKEAITRGDIENLISKGVIKKKALIGQSRSRARALHLKKKKGRRKGYGSRKGVRTARSNFTWLEQVRVLRAELVKQRDAKKIDGKMFRVLYRKVKGNAFHSLTHMRSVIEEMKKEQ